MNPKTLSYFGLSLVFSPILTFQSLLSFFTVSGVQIANQNQENLDLMGLYSNQDCLRFID